MADTCKKLFHLSDSAHKCLWEEGGLGILRWTAFKYCDSTVSFHLHLHVLSASWKCVERDTHRKCTSAISSLWIFPLLAFSCFLFWRVCCQIWHNCGQCVWCWIIVYDAKSTSNRLRPVDDDASRKSCSQNWEWILLEMLMNSRLQRTGLKCLLTQEDSWHSISASVFSRGRCLLPLNKISLRSVSTNNILAVRDMRKQTNTWQEWNWIKHQFKYDETIRKKKK